MKTERGYVVVITGEGKGKTTSALGMALRAVGHNFRVIMLQFIKGSTRYGELEAAKRLAPEFEIVQLGRGFVHVDPASPDPKDVATARAAWDLAKGRILSGDYFMVVLDEINNAIEYGLLPVGEVLEVLEKKPQGVTLVLTGRGADPRIIAAADLVSEVKEVKHPYREGQKARKGIEY